MLRRTHWLPIVIILVQLFSLPPTGLYATRIPWIAQPANSDQGSSGIYTEDFSTYAAKDYTDDTEWDIWSHSLRTGRDDAISRSAPSIGVDGAGDIIAVWVATSNSQRFVYAQKVDINGNRLWPNDVRVNAQPGTLRLDKTSS